jgi:hypothetical protein
MPTVSASTELAATQDTVWALISDFSRYGEWNETHTGFPDGTPELAEGASYLENVRIMGMPGQVKWTVTEVQEPSRLRLDGAGPMGIALGQVLELAASGDGTTVSLQTSFAGGPLAGPMGVAVAQAGEKAAAASLQKLKAML